MVVYPRGRVTPVQEKHMTTCLQDNIHVFSGILGKREGRSEQHVLSTLIVIHKGNHLLWVIFDYSVVGLYHRSIATDYSVILSFN